MPPFRSPCRTPLVAALCALAACAGAPREESDTPAVDPMVCTAPRPQVCTMLYDPVCALRSDGLRETLSSPCNACADDGVVRWSPGSCEDQDATES